MITDRTLTRGLWVALIAGVVVLGLSMVAAPKAAPAAAEPCMPMHMVLEKVLEVARSYGVGGDWIRTVGPTAGEESLYVMLNGTPTAIAYRFVDGCYTSVEDVPFEDVPLPGLQTGPPPAAVAVPPQTPT